MTTHYSTKGFFRNTPNAMLARYFAAREVLQDFDFKAIKETKIEPLFEAWMTLPEAQRAPMEVDLRAIGDMSKVPGKVGAGRTALLHCRPRPTTIFRSPPSAPMRQASTAAAKRSSSPCMW